MLETILVSGIIVLCVIVVCRKSYHQINDAIDPEKKGNCTSCSSCSNSECSDKADKEPNT